MHKSIVTRTNLRATSVMDVSLSTQSAQKQYVMSQQTVGHGVFHYNILHASKRKLRHTQKHIKHKNQMLFLVLQDHMGWLYFNIFFKQLSTTSACIITPCKG